MEQIQLKNVRTGDFIKRTETASRVYVKGHYVRDGSRSYSCTDSDDMNKEIFIKGNKMVWVGFTY